MTNFFSYEECILHLDQLITLDHYCFPDSKWGEDTWRAVLTQKNFILAVFQRDGKILAYLLASYLLEEAELYRLGVQDSDRNKGIAQQMLGTACHELRKNAIRVLFLEVRADNTAAIRFYQKNNFKKIGVRKRYYRSPVCDGFCFKKHLE